MIEVDVALNRGDFDLRAAFSSGPGVTALFGPSGCGKSTVINLIAGLARPDEGHVVIDGRTLVDTQKRVFTPAYKRRVGLVFQDALLFPHLSVQQNLRFGAFFAPRAARGLNLQKVVDTLGIGHLMDRRPVQLSGGERQRVGVARALMSAPQILLMDEPFASLDVARRKQAMGLVEMVRDQFSAPIILVSHAIEEVMRLASRVVLMEAGRVMETGTPEEVFASGHSADPADRFGVVSEISCKTGEFNAKYGMTVLHHPAGEIFTLQQPNGAHRKLRVFINATDVVLALRPPPDVSIRTSLKGRVLRIARSDGPLALATIELEGGERLFASLSRMAADELHLAPGVEVVALVKAVALDESP